MNEQSNQTNKDPDLTGGDLDANQYQAEVVGEEAVGGLTPTPDQSIVDELAASTGVEIQDFETLAMEDKLDERDNNRWELEPDSKD